MANVVNYFEIGTPDAGATTAFYGGLFDWQDPHGNRFGVWRPKG